MGPASKGCGRLALVSVLCALRAECVVVVIGALMYSIYRGGFGPRASRAMALGVAQNLLYSICSFLAWLKMLG